MNDQGITRLLAEIDRDKDRDCRACGEYPAVLGGLCGYCRGKDLASRQAPQAWKPESEKPRTPRRTLI